MTKEEKNAFSYRIMQASPTELIVILYEMAECYLGQAIENCEAGKVEGFRSDLKYAGRVVNELVHALDFRYEISQNFMQIYMYINRVLVKASITCEVEDVRRCIGMLAKLRTSFDQVKDQDRRGSVMKNTQQVYAGLTYSKGNLNESFGLESNRGFRV